MKPRLLLLALGALCLLLASCEASQGVVTDALKSLNLGSSKYSASANVPPSSTPSPSSHTHSPSATASTQTHPSPSPHFQAQTHAQLKSPPVAQITPLREEGRSRIRVSSLLKDLVKPKRKRNIGITISIRPNETSVWTNGAKQNAFFMYQVYTYEGRNNVYLINLHMGTVKDLSDDWNVKGLPIMDLEEALTKDLDVVIESGMQISTPQMQRMQKMGIKVASFRTGNDYFMIAEETIFQRPVSTMFMTLRYDALWTLPAYDFIMHWQSTMFRAPIEKVPYVWSPFFHDLIARLSPERPKYTPRETAKTISIFEPNLYIVKNFVMPLAMVEAFYRQYPDLVREVFVLNADKFLHDHPAFDAFTSVLDVVQQNKTRFIPRFRVPWFLSTHGDVVLSHQMHNDLNFLYLDALYAHYPLVHNSPYFKDCGYYYDVNNITMAVEKLYEATVLHDRNIEAYNKRADECVERFSVFHPDNVAGYERLVDNILALPPRFP